MRLPVLPLIPKNPDWLGFALGGPAVPSLPALGWLANPTEPPGSGVPSIYPLPTPDRPLMPFLKPIVTPLATERAQWTLDEQQARLGKTLLSKVPALNAALEAQRPVPTLFPGRVLTNGLADVGNLLAGVQLARQPVSSPTIPERWRAYDAQVQQRSQQGLLDQELAQGQRQINNNYTQGYNALNQLTGGGSSPGVSLAGQTNLGLLAGQQRQSLLAMDGARRQQNAGLYGPVVAQTAAMESALEANRIGRQSARNVAGVNLIQATRQNRENRSLFEQNAPGYAALGKAQLDAYTASAATQQALRAYYEQLAGEQNSAPLWIKKT